MDFVAHVGTERRPGTSRNASPTIAVQVSDRSVVGANLADAMDEPGALGRIGARQRVSEPHVAARHQVCIAFSVHVGDPAANGLLTAAGHLPFAPVQIGIPDQRPLAASTG